MDADRLNAQLVALDMISATVRADQEAMQALAQRAATNPGPVVTALLTITAAVLTSTYTDQSLADQLTQWRMLIIAGHQDAAR